MHVDTPLTHDCPVPGCNAGNLPHHILMCYQHWRLVPRRLQARVNRLWREQPYTEAYMAARAEAIKAVTG